jgi:hypothetical protein
MKPGNWARIFEIRVLVFWSGVGCGSWRGRTGVESGGWDDQWSIFGDPLGSMAFPNGFNAGESGHFEVSPEFWDGRKGPFLDKAGRRMIQ